MVKPLIWPDWQETDPDIALLAKSLKYSVGDTPETLADHTWQVMQRLSELIYLRPSLPEEIGVPRLWNTLFWAAFLHDFGKAAAGFQARLRGGDRWPHRHEVLSLAFVDWITPGLSAEEQEWLVAAIVSHHKDAADILLSYAEPDPDDPYDVENDQMPPLVAELDRDTLHNLWRWLAECPAAWRSALNLDDFDISLLPVMEQAKAVAHIQRNGADRIYYWLNRYSRFVRQLKRNKKQIISIGALTLRGYLTNADHAASSHRGAFYSLTVDANAILQSRNIERKQLYTHQSQAEQQQGSILLTAPTGSGKTEAALLWAASQTANTGGKPRLFYTLPYQASMNAMKLRLDKIFGEEQVGLQHGRAAMAHYRMLLEGKDDDANPEDALQQVKLAQDMARLNYPPVRVFSPYQMLKGPYRLKGYEKQLSDYHHALFIFDEIHAYEAKRLALILETVKYLRQNFQARFIVMSATFPHLIKTALQDALGNVFSVNAANALFESENFQRHRLNLHDGQLLDNLDQIDRTVQSGKSTLVACNLVAVAQTAYDTLRKKLPQTIKMILLHGRFNMRDRSRIEKLVREYANPDAAQPQPFVLVATQAVEVSLDIDLDTIYTEPAPLDALVQRFGRVNRRGKKGVSDVYVFRECDWDTQKYVYNPDIVEATLRVLERENNQPVNEKKIGNWLNEIYQGEIADAWSEEYRQAANEFYEAWLKRLRPFEAITNKNAQEFYKLFDGVEVLPQSLVKQYEDYLADKEFLKANELLVPMRYSQLQSIHSQRRDPAYFDGGWPVVVDLPYTPENGLDMSLRKELPERRIATA